MNTGAKRASKMGQFEKGVHWACRKLDLISGIALVLMMLLIAANVIARQVWTPIEGTYEFTAFLASITVSFALAYCARNNGHIALTLLVDRFPPRVQAFFDIIVNSMGAALFLVLSWQVAKYALQTSRTGEVAPTTELPFYPFIYGVALGLFMLAMVLLLDLLGAFVRICKK